MNIYRVFVAYSAQLVKNAKSLKTMVHLVSTWFRAVFTQPIENKQHPVRPLGSPLGSTRFFQPIENKQHPVSTRLLSPTPHTPLRMRAPCGSRRMRNDGRSERRVWLAHHAHPDASTQTPPTGFWGGLWGGSESRPAVMGRWSSPYRRWAVEAMRDAAQQRQASVGAYRARLFAAVMGASS